MPRSRTSGNPSTGPLVAVLAACLIILGGTAAVQASPTPGTSPSTSSTTSGSGEDPHMPSLVWAPLKTGFRAVVAWTSPQAAVGEVTYQAGDGPTWNLVETTPKRNHVFVLRDLPQGSNLTFTASHTTTDGATVTSDTHTFHLGNAMHAYNASKDAYTLNLLVLANEAVRDDQLETVTEGLRGFAQRLWDASDGHVRAGTTVVLRGDWEHHDSGFVTCGGFGVGPVEDTPNCHHLADIVFTYDHHPLAAGLTWKGAIAKDDRPIYMNNLWETDFQDDVPMVILHEVGHYAFWMDDLYTLTGETCYDASLDISVMGSRRDVTEFDGPNAPCPNGDTFEPYTPSWTALRNHYPQVPERSNGPDAGPTGNGGAFDLHVFDLPPTDASVDPWNDVVRVSPRGDAGAQGMAGSGTGTARSGVLAASATGPAEGVFAVSGTGTARACTMFSLVTPCVGASGLGNAEGVVAVSGGGDASSCPSHLLLTPCVAASGTGDASAGRVAVSVAGNASCSADTCVAVEVLSTVEGSSMSTVVPGQRLSELPLP